MESGSCDACENERPSEAGQAPAFILTEEK